MYVFYVSSLSHGLNVAMATVLVKAVYGDLLPLAWDSVDRSGKEDLFNMGFLYCKLRGKAWAAE